MGRSFIRYCKNGHDKLITGVYQTYKYEWNKKGEFVKRKAGRPCAQCRRDNINAKSKSYEARLNILLRNSEWLIFLA